MNRRNFLSFLFGSSAAVVVAPRLWRPSWRGLDVGFGPSYSAHRLLTSELVAREALKLLEANLTLARNVNRFYDSALVLTAPAIGSTVDVRRPRRFAGGHLAAAVD